jgi:predicted ATPase
VHDDLRRKIMLKHIEINGYKSLRKVKVELSRLTVLFGPNASGKSNFIDGLQVLSRIASNRTLSDAISEPLRGYPIEQFSFPIGGLASLLSQDTAEFSFSVDLETGKPTGHYRYAINVCIRPASGSLSVGNEYLSILNKKGEVKGNPSIEKMSDQIRIRRKSKPANPQREPLNLNYAILSDTRFRGIEYRPIERCREELSGWRTYYLDPRVAMRSAMTPSDVLDIGPLGGAIAPFLYKLSNSRKNHYMAIKRTLKSLIPRIEDLNVDLDKKRGVLDITVQQDGIDYSNRIISEGTLRVLSLCAIAANPWGSGLVAFEEPENGVHPRRLELIADLLAAMALDQGRQVVVTTHSPLLCEAILRKQKENPHDISLMKVGYGAGGTIIDTFDVTGPLFSDQEIRAALANGAEDGLFEGLLMRGLIDE